MRKSSPTVPEIDSSTNLPSPGTRGSPGAFRPGGAPDILIVDDEPRNLQLLGTLLRDHGYHTSFATGGQQALDVARRVPPGLILLDINLPGLDGLDVCRALRADEQKELRDVPVIFLTARTQPEDILAGFEAGGVDYVTKPFKSEELLARVQTHLDLRHMREDLARINENQRRFFTLLAHDLRNPIGGLKDMPDLLLDQDSPPTPEFVREIAGIMKDEARRVFDLLEELLLLSRLQMGRASPLAGDFRVAPVLSHVLEHFGKEAQEKGVHLEMEAASRLTAHADHHMIGMVVRNLVQNGLKFTGSGGRVRVRASACAVEDLLETEGNLDIPLDHEHGYVCIRVSDTGMGVRPELAEYLFDPLRSRSTPGTAKESGSGLGLPMCAQLLQLHGSRLLLDSKAGSGASFFFYLPAARED